MITKAALVATLVATLAAAWFWAAAGRLEVENDRLEREAAAYERRFEQMDQAKRVLDDHLDRAETEARDLEAALAATRNMEGSDAPLSDYERAVLDRLLRP